MSNNINDREYILHYKVYDNKILYFIHDYTLDYFYYFHSMYGDVEIENDEIYIAPNNGIYTLYDLPSYTYIHEKDDFTIYFRIRLHNPNANKEYHILYDGLSLQTDGTTPEEKHAHPYAFQIKISNYRLLLLHGLPSISYKVLSEPLIDANVSALADEQQHYISISRYQGKLRAHLDGKKIYDAYSIKKIKNKDKFFIPTWELDDNGDPIYIPDVTIGSSNTDDFYINDLVVCRKFAFYRNLDYDVIPDDIVSPKHTKAFIAIDVPRSIATTRIVRYTCSIRFASKKILLGVVKVKFATKLESVIENYTVNFFTEKIYDALQENLNLQTERKIILKFDDKDYPYSANTKRQIIGVVKVKFHTKKLFGMENLPVYYDLKRILNYKINYTFNTKRNIITSLLNNKISTIRNIIIGSIGKNGNKGCLFNTERIVKFEIEDIFTYCTRNVICNSHTMYNTIRTILIIGDKNHPSSVVQTERIIHETCYVFTNTNVMSILSSGYCTKRNVVIVVKPIFKTRRYVKSFTRPCMVFVYNSKIHLLN